ncbi:hypothetical protein LCGC14_2641600 [marine sediment metagenome]|uniref:AP2/ERF domain-containing protein n=1 Tax=marine sediment metagenome TaxID=412755 RepID=A0A0F9CPK2_9ZZZZ
MADWHQIPLTKGKLALVSSKDWSAVSQFKWRAIPSGSKWYAATNMLRENGTDEQGRYQTVLLHRLIMGAPEGCRVKHTNEDTLDCRRSNLSVISRRGFKGYTWSIEKKAWKVEARQGGNRKLVGYFDDEYDAAVAHDLATIKLVGKDADLNFSMEVLKEARKRRR